MKNQALLDVRWWAHRCAYCLLKILETSTSREELSHLMKRVDDVRRTYSFKK
jgi:hypothetical protein